MLWNLKAYTPSYVMDKIHSWKQLVYVHSSEEKQQHSSLSVCSYRKVISRDDVERYVDGMKQIAP